MYKWQSDFMKYLKLYNNHLTRQQYKTLKGQAMNKNEKACIKGLVTILKREGIEINLSVRR